MRWGNTRAQVARVRALTGLLPRATMVVVAGLILVRVVAYYQAKATGHNLVTGAALCAPCLGRGQYYRLVTASWVHADLGHLAQNALVLLFVGCLAEPLLHGPWLFTVFTVCAVGSTIGSLFCGHWALLSVGASGATFGLLAAACILAFRFGGLFARCMLWSTLCVMGLWALVPSLNLTTVDLGNHWGGLLSGLIAGWALLASFPLNGPCDRTAARLGVVLAFASGLLTASAFVLALRSLPYASTVAPLSRPCTR
jgi:membrane associated rhomboid family serine protease